MKMPSKLKWALVLSGGGARGLAHVGILNALAEMGAPEPSLVVGTSMGAIVGGLYACGMGPAELTRFLIDKFDITELLDSFVFKINGPVGKVFQTGQLLGSLATGAGLDSGRRILELFEELTEAKTFAETRIPFRCNAVDLAEGRELVFSSGSVARAMRASMSFPAFFEPLVEGDRCLVDGGLANNMPVYIARNEGFSRILAVDTGNFSPRPASDFKTGAQIVYRCLEVVFNMIKRKGEVKAALTVHASNDLSPFEFSRKQEFVTLGERTIRENKKAVQVFFNGGIRAWFGRKLYRECGVSLEDTPCTDSIKALKPW
ncbi:MAG: patatin-like phospholipase family protein [Treponema sp.]|jgi:NTE family protein|nr:patatin-like phospholipase family protein [Treponema sp.]